MIVAFALWFFGLAAEFNPPANVLQQQPALQQDIAATHTKVAEPTPVEAGEPTGSNTLCSINVANQDLAKILQELTVQTRTNLILLSPPETKLTLNLSKVSLKDMLRHIAAITGLVPLKVGSTYVIATEAKLRAAYPVEWEASFPTPVVKPQAAVQVSTETYTTKYVDSKQIVDALKELFKEDHLLILGGPTSMSPTVAQQETGSATGNGGSAGVLSKETGVAQAGRMIVLQGPKEAVAAAIAMAKKLDYARPQWVVNVTIHDISNDALREAGLSWSFGNLTVNESGVKNMNLGSFSRTPLSFLATLAALETQDKAKLLSAPSISGLDGERAFILIGERLSFPNLIGFSQANTPIFEKEEIRVGIYLQVAATVSDDKHLTLSLYPQVSSILRFKTINGASYPDISTREAQTTVRVTAGETIVLGGMLRDEEVSHMSKVPLLGDIPFLGELFKNRRRTKVSSQVIITLTPTIIPADELR